jgi:peptidoglycan glycosyltransferase
MSLMEKRIRWVGILMVVLFVALFVQLNNIQIFRSNALANSPSNPRQVALQHSQPRGDIISADGITLANSVSTSGKSSYKYKRVYNPYTAVLFSQIVGYDSEIYGMTGVEAYYNQYLESHTRPARNLKDLLVNRTTTDDVTLTLSTQLQTQVAAALDAADVSNSAPETGAVVLNVKTGAIEAMYGNPTFDPRGLVSTDGNVEKFNWALLNSNRGESPLVSRAFQRGFLPGSTFKVVTSSAVYDHAPAVANINYPVTGCISVPQTPLPLCNYHQEQCGGTIQTTLPVSCNTAFAQMGMALKSNLGVAAQAFGFNQRIPVDLPGAGVSTAPTPAQLVNNPPLQAYAAFGQGTAVATDVATPLQMALVAEAIAHDGVIMTPHVMQSIRDSQGHLVTSYTPSPWVTATSPLTAAAVTSLMRGVVTNGTAAGVGFPPEWDVAAKTGTAEVGTSAHPLTNDWMVAFAPANAPKVAVAVAVPNQAPSSTGAEISGPVMKTILGYALAATP